VFRNATRLGLQILKTNLNSLQFPFKLTFCITFRCQSRCKTCSIWQLKPENELTLDEIEEFIKKADFLSWINLTGGEVFLREDLVDICKIFAKRRKIFLLNFATNGLMPSVIPQKVEEILRLPIDRVIIGVSLDGPESLNDDIRGIKGDWEKGIQTFLKLKELAKKHKKFRAYIGYTLSDYNTKKFQEFYRELKKKISDIKEDDIHVNLAHQSTHYYHTNQSQTSKIDPEELEKIVQFKKSSLNPINWLENKYLSYAKQFLLTAKTPLPCHAIQTSCYIDSWGNVYPCTIYDKKIGSLRESEYDLAKIIKSQPAGETRKEVSELHCPNCWTPCEAYQMILSNMVKKNK
jgi:radical SAM protein with 4Fe4S-binding SPASM domain